MATVERPRLMTAGEFGKRPDSGSPEELVQGRVVGMPLTDPRHGEICAQGVYLFKRFLEDQDLGRIVANDAGVLTERDPDTVRGPDVAFYSYARLPKGPIGRGYRPEVPELVLEVRSPSDRWRDIQAKVTEYLVAGVLTVVVLDPEPRAAHVFGADDPPRTLGPEDDLALPGILAGFRVRVDRFFE